MTTGSRVVDDSHSVALVHTEYHPSTGAVVSQSTTSCDVGRKMTKTWSGLDQSPPVSRKKITYVWTTPGYTRVRLVKRGLYGVSKSIYSREWVYGKTYRRTIREGQTKRQLRDDHPYSATITITSDAVFTKRRKEYGVLASSGTYSMFQTFGGLYSTVTDPWNANDTLKLVGKLRTEIAGSGFNLGVFLGEGREALQMIGDAAVKIGRAYSAAKQGNFILAAELLLKNRQKTKMVATKMRGDLLGDLNSSWVLQKEFARDKFGRKVYKIDPLKRAPDHLKDELKHFSEIMSQRWLELQYGWLPILKDTADAAEYLARLLNFPMERSYTARVSKPHQISYTSSSIGEIDPKNRIKSYGKLIARVQSLNELNLVLGNPASIAWELTPFSFVADWFIPIGQYLDARGLAGSLQASYVTTITRKEKVRARGPKYVNNGPVSETGSPGEWALVQRIITDRTVSSSLSIPLPTVKPLAKIASWRHCANAVALLVATHGSGSTIGSRGHTV